MYMYIYIYRYIHTSIHTCNKIQKGHLKHGDSDGSQLDSRDAAQRLDPEAHARRGQRHVCRHPLFSRPKFGER